MLSICHNSRWHQQGSPFRRGCEKKSSQCFISDMKTSLAKIKLETRCELPQRWFTFIASVRALAPQIPDPNSSTVNPHNDRGRKQDKTLEHCWVEAAHTNTSPSTCSTLIFKHGANKPAWRRRELQLSLAAESIQLYDSGQRQSKCTQGHAIGENCSRARWCPVKNKSGQ